MPPYPMKTAEIMRNCDIVLALKSAAQRREYHER